MPYVMSSERIELLRLMLIGDAIRDSTQRLETEPRGAVSDEKSPLHENCKWLDSSLAAGTDEVILMLQ